MPVTVRYACTACNVIDINYFHTYWCQSANFPRPKVYTAHTCPQALLRAQAELRQMVPGFTFNAGFVGGYYNSGALMEEVSSTTIDMVGKDD